MDAEISGLGIRCLNEHEPTAESQSGKQVHPEQNQT